MMSPTSAALQLLFPAAAVVLLVTALQLSAAAAAEASPSASIGLPGCNTTCGNVRVPYPFGFGPSHCYWPGLNLTCDTRHDPPLLLLGDGSLRVTKISVRNATVHVIPTNSIINTTGDFTSDSWNAPFGRGFLEYGYQLSYRNELVVSGCNITAMLLADIGETSPRFISGCTTFCSKSDRNGSLLVETTFEETKSCTYNLGCCRAPLTTTSSPHEVQAKWLYGGNHTEEQSAAPVKVFVAEEGWIDQNSGLVSANEGWIKEAPMVLGWTITQGLPMRNSCDEDIRRMLCKSIHSHCSAGDLTKGYTCGCDIGYDGNPYLPGGCIQDIDECTQPNDKNGCFGECINTMGSYDCLCPRGTYGSPGIKGGCVRDNPTTDVLPPPQIGLPGCHTTCGGISVPYPFGFSPGCYWPGFNLTCDTSLDPPRLLLNSDSTIEVIDISLSSSTVRVIHRTIGSLNINYANESVEVYFDLPDIAEPYMLSSRNDLVVFGCDVQATLYAEYINSSGGSSTNIINSGCVSTCSSGHLSGDPDAGPLVIRQSHGRHCSGRDGCCHAPIMAGSTPKKVEFKGFHLNTSHENPQLWENALAFISAEGLIDQWYMILNRTGLSMPHDMASPLDVQWAVKQGLLVSADNSGQCPGDVASHLCKSEHSVCSKEMNGGYTCHCDRGYQGNPYIPHGCQDIDECSMAVVYSKCFGDCINEPGGFQCHCPQGTHGNPFKSGGCGVRSKTNTGLIIGLSVASGPALLLLVLGIILVLDKMKQQRIKILKQKYFNQNRGQLLQQLVSQKADIAERMIIPVDELAKATNNFDKARELGGGGHGTVYKGILSDLHVVAIKKSKITVQKEIDEFINEVAILSQINHKNVVKLFGCCLETEVPLLVYEFISNGTLYHHLHVEGPTSLSWANRLRIATEIATSLAYLHSAVAIPIIHRDIKSSNILLDDTLTTKVSDFGASRYIPVEKTGLTTRVQGTIGYLDPMYFYTSRLTEKSDVYSFGVILVELLTRKIPVSYLSTEGDGLVSHFVSLFAEGNLVQIIDPQVTEEGGEEIHEVAALAASCINLRGEERPTMRQVEHSLEGLRGFTRHKKDDTGAVDFDSDSAVINCITSTEEGQRFQESSRRYSLEQEMMMSSRYPR